MRVLLLLTAAAFAAAFWLHIDGIKEEADFLLRSFTGLSVLVAVVVAVYGDRIKNAANRIHLRIENTEQTDNFFNFLEDGGRSRRDFCHHLLVRNLTPSRTVENCRVWLVKILDQDSKGKFHEDFRFAVPRLMQWAPQEYSPDARSFSEDQVFDFGRCFVDEGRFEVAVYEKQGGVFRGFCEAGKSRRYVFRITADNYLKAKTVAVQVSVKSVEKTEEWKALFRAEVEVRRKLGWASKALQPVVPGMLASRR